ncbi:MAG TPA: hypothetical protein VNO50_18270 [Pyrinomonadaceae bacterium]|nr:hypothetical protein [Pyrinomonadaceae bacterium]
MNHTFIVLIVTRDMVYAVDGHTLLKPVIVPDGAVITFFLQCFAVSFYAALGNGR